jgi:calcineurin-like phosphoesterase family protein
MNEGLINNWNSVVHDGDTVWSLGDFAFVPKDKIVEIIKRLNGNLHMVLGNHDNVIKNSKEQMLREGLVKEIVDYKEIKWNKQKICLFHYAQRAWNSSHHGSWQLFGHTHGTMEPYGKSVDVGVDSPFVTGTPPYRPFSFDEIHKFMETQIIEKDF